MVGIGANRNGIGSADHAGWEQEGGPRPRKLERITCTPLDACVATDMEFSLSSSWVTTVLQLLCSVTRHCDLQITCGPSCFIILDWSLTVSIITLFCPPLA